MRAVNKLYAIQFIIRVTMMIGDDSKDVQSPMMLSPRPPSLTSARPSERWWKS